MVYELDIEGYFMTVDCLDGEKNHVLAHLCRRNAALYCPSYMKIRKQKADLETKLKEIVKGNWK